MNNLIAQSAVTTVNGIAQTTSLEVAKAFGKDHRNIMRDIRCILSQVVDKSELLNFERFEMKYKNNFGKMVPRICYSMSKDAFMLLVMGFTGSEALKIKLAYIEAFNEMEAKLKSQSALPPPPPPPPKNPIAYLCSPGEYEAHIKMSVKDIPPKADQLSAYSLLDILDGLGYPVERALVEIALMHHYTVYMRGMSEVLEYRLLPSLLESLKARDKLYAIGDFKNGTSDIRSGMSFQD